MDDKTKGKSIAAAICVLVAVLGMVAGFRWLTVAALIGWVASLAYFGLGERSRPAPPPESYWEERDL
ncbi:MAG: hypothetical protein AAF752_16210 [Bacteroidota bacterium]